MGRDVSFGASNTNLNGRNLSKKTHKMCHVSSCDNITFFCLDEISVITDYFFSKFSTYKTLKNDISLIFNPNNISDITYLTYVRNTLTS